MTTTQCGQPLDVPPGCPGYFFGVPENVDVTLTVETNSRLKQGGAFRIGYRGGETFAQGQWTGAGENKQIGTCEFNSNYGGVTLWFWYYDSAGHVQQVKNVKWTRDSENTITYSTEDTGDHSDFNDLVMTFRW